LLRKGAPLLLLNVLAAEGKKTSEGLSKEGRDAVFIKCDVTHGSQVKEMIDQVIGKFGKVDILINNAGITGLPKSVTETPEEEWIGF